MSKKKIKRKKTLEPRIAIGIFQSDVKTFLEEFKSEVAKKRGEYQLYCQKFRTKEK